MLPYKNDALRSQTSHSVRINVSRGFPKGRVAPAGIQRVRICGKQSLNPYRRRWHKFEREHMECSPTKMMPCVLRLHIEKKQELR